MKAEMVVDNSQFDPTEEELAKYWQEAVAKATDRHQQSMKRLFDEIRSQAHQMRENAQQKA